MKLKPKLTGRRIAVLAVAVLGAGAVMFARLNHGEPARRGLDAAGRHACQDFADGLPKAKSKVSRLALADRVILASGGTGDDQIAKRAAEMGRSAGDGGDAWKSSAAALTGACRDAGWSQTR